MDIAVESVMEAAVQPATMEKRTKDNDTIKSGSLYISHTENRLPFQRINYAMYLLRSSIALASNASCCFC